MTNFTQINFELLNKLRTYLVLLLTSFSLIIFILIGISSFAQYTYELDKTTRFDKMGVEEGLSTEYTTRIHQDKYGFIWIGTQKGLNLYDGYEVKEFNSNLKDSNSLFNDHIENIYEEADGTMWFCTLRGLSNYNRANQVFTNYLPDTIDLGNPKNIIRKILEDGNFLWVDVYHDLLRFNKHTGEFKSFGKDTLNPLKGIKYKYTRYIFIDGSGVLWVCSKSTDAKRALSRFDKKTETFFHYQNEPSNPESFVNNTVYSMMEDKEGTIWIATYGGGLLEVIDKEKGKFKQYLHDDSETNSIITNRLLTIFEDSKGNIWAGGYGGFSLLNKKTRSFTNYQIPNRIHNPNRVNAIKDITEDESGNLWLTAFGCLFSFDPITLRLLHYVNDPDNESSLNGNHILQMIIDRAGQTWVVCGNTGVDRINQFSNVLTKVQKQNHVKNSLSSNFIGRLFVDSRNHFWIGCYDDGGLNRTKMNKDRVFDTFEHFIMDVNNPKSISSNTVNAIYEDHDHIIWSGGWEGLDKYDELNNSFTHFQHDPDDFTSISSNEVEVIFEDSFGTFWVGTRDGLNIMDKETGEFIRILPDENDSSSNSRVRIREIYEDSYGELWIGGRHLEKLNRMDTSFTIYPQGINNTELNMRSYISVREDDSSNLWVATNRGILHWRRHSNSYEIIAGEQGLSSDYLVDLEIDDQGNIWVCSNRGLSRVNPKTSQIRNFDIEDGLITLEIIDRSLFKDKDGWLYFGTREGFNYFHPDSIKENTCIPPVYITSLIVAGKPKYFDQPLYELENIELHYNENDISFDFVALNYINTQKNQYAFMLEGYDEDWKYVGNRRSAYYTNLSPGKYTFRVKGSNNDGFWNEEGASLDVIIHPPFWATWWAYGLYGFLFLLILYVVRRNELKKVRLQQNLELEKVRSEEMSKLDTEKNKFFSNISHEFRTPLTLILGPLERIITGKKAGQEKDQLNLVRRNASRLQILINQLLSLSKLEEGKMKLKTRPENVVQLSRLLLNSFHSLAEDRGIKTEFVSDADEHMVYLDKLKFEKIANNLLSNAFKFTEKGGKIKVSVAGSDPSPSESSQKGVWIKFADTGIGIRKERLDHVFDRFYQVDEQQNKSSLGTGIGLALTKELVELHHGEIHTDSEFGMGTTFTVFLPIGKDHLSEDEIVEATKEMMDAEDELLQDKLTLVQETIPNPDQTIQTVSVDNNLPLLLIVEDNNDMRAYIKSYLTDSCQVLEAINGKEGEEMAIEHVPDLIVSDLMMPFVDGNEMTARLKSNEKTSHIPIILLTAKSSTATKLEGLETGADDFLTKPFDAAELLVRIKNLVEQRRKLREMLSRHIGDNSQTRIIRETAGKAMSKLDEQFLEKVKICIDKDMSNPEFSVEMLAQELAMSRSQLHRKLKSLVNVSATDFIRDIRLQRAAELLKEGDLNITQISYEIGISSLSYFSKSFREKFGVTPSEYA